MEIFSRNISYIDLHHIGILKKNFRDLRQETKTACSIPFVPIELEPVTLSRAVCYVICNAAQSAITFCTVSGMMILLENYFQYFSNNIYIRTSALYSFTLKVISIEHVVDKCSKNSLESG